jgi:hypothetical protein
LADYPAGTRVIVRMPGEVGRGVAEPAEHHPPRALHERGLLGGVDELVDLDPAPAVGRSEVGVGAVLATRDRDLVVGEVSGHDTQLGVEELPVSAADLRVPFHGRGEVPFSSETGRRAPMNAPSLRRCARTTRDCGWSVASRKEASSRYPFMCQQLAVSRSGFYDWVCHERGRRTV